MNYGLFKLLLAPDPAPAASGGNTGDYASASADASAQLLKMMTPSDPAPARENKGSDPASAPEAPEIPVAPAELEAPGQTDLPPENPPPTEGDEPAEGASDPSQSTNPSNLPAEIAALPEGERTKLLTQLADAIKNGE